MIAFFGSALGLAVVAGYVYVGVMFGRASVRAGNSFQLL